MEIYLPMRQFFHNLIHPEYSAVTDVYVLMFLADTVDFIIIVFGYAAFGVRLTSQYFLSSLCTCFNDAPCFPFRNTLQGTSPRLCQRTRFQGLSWSWCWSSLVPWWWTVPSTSGSLSWGRSSFRSSSSLESTSGCSSSCQESLRSKTTNQDDFKCFEMLACLCLCHSSISCLSCPAPTYCALSQSWNALTIQWCTLAGVSVRTWSLRCGISSSASTLDSRPIRSAVATPPAF